jgi:hypothetical protein
MSSLRGKVFRKRYDRSLLAALIQINSGTADVYLNSAPIRAARALNSFPEFRLESLGFPNGRAVGYGWERDAG